MKRFLQAAVIAAGLAVAISAAAGAEEARRPANLTSFGTTQSASAFHFSPGAMVPMSTPGSTSRSDFAPPSFWGSSMADPLSLHQSFAASLALTSHFALDTGFNTDIAQRFANFDGYKSPLLDSASALGLANGGAYAGVTWMPAASLYLRAGASLRDDRMDRFAYDPVSRTAGYTPGFEAGRSRTLLAGIFWDMSDWANIGLTALHNEQTGRPWGVLGGADPLAELTHSSQVSTNALDVAARVNLGNNWVTTASVGLSGSLSQLDQRVASAPQAEARSYSIAIAKRGLFGDDALGLSFSQPAPSVLESGFDMVAASGDLPPVFVASGRLPSQTPETDLQLGYVTSFLDGALALQTNASYQMNYQGQTGATSLSVLSRAKIKF